MSWYDDYKAIWDALVTIVSSITDFGTNVFYGEKDNVDEFPSAYVCPEPIELEPGTTLKTFDSYYFSIGVVTKSSVVKDNYLKGFELIGKIHDAIIADRCLGGKSDTLEVIRVEPNWRHPTQGIEVFWIGLILMVRKLRP